MAEILSQHADAVKPSQAVSRMSALSTFAQVRVHLEHSLTPQLESVVDEVAAAIANERRASLRALSRALVPER